jgi:uncharacterized protein (DUF362 family)
VLRTNSMEKIEKAFDSIEFSRREFLLGLAGFSLFPFISGCQKKQWQAETFIAKAADYSADLRGIILSGLKELGIKEPEIKGKHILLKPNLVEPHLGKGHINTHPLVIQGAAEAFYSLGAGKVMVGEGPGHIRDTQHVVENAGYRDILGNSRLPFINLNDDQVITVPNIGKKTDLKILLFPSTVKRVDWVVSVAKMKTHHLAGVTLSMKNLFGVMPGNYYGWPKNVLHFAGIHEAVFDINSTLKPHFAIIDGIVGMEGDGPIMGLPKKAGVIIMGRNFPGVDATAARIMGINPHKISYLAMAENCLGPVSEKNIRQVGETIGTVQSVFALLDKIPAHQGIKN